MSLTRDRNQRLLDRFDELLTVGNNLTPRMESHFEAVKSQYVFSDYPTDYGHVTECQHFLVNVRTLIEHVFGGTDRERDLIQHLNTAEVTPETTLALVELHLGTLQGLRSDFKQGFLESFESTIVAEVASDYIEQLEDMLKPKRLSDLQLALIAAGCGMLLERELRGLCKRQTPAIDVRKPNSQFKKMDALITELQQAHVYNAIKSDQLRSWAKIRNAADHGHFKDFNRRDVETMLDGVKGFLADYVRP